MANKNVIIAKYKETQEVILFVMALVKAIETVDKVSDESQQQATWLALLANLPSLMPVFTTFSAAVDNVREVEVELRAASKEEAAELRAWVAQQVPDLEHDKIEEFIKDAFDVVLSLWVFINTYFITGSLKSEENSSSSDEGTAEKSE